MDGGYRVDLLADCKAQMIFIEYAGAGIRGTRRQDREQSGMTIRPIRTDEDYQSALKRAKSLFGQSSQKDLDEREVLQALIERWERIEYSVEQPLLLRRSSSAWHKPAFLNVI